MDFKMDFNAELEKLKSNGCYRELRNLNHLDNGKVEFNNKIFYNLSSNDYMGIGTNSSLREEFFAKLDPKMSSMALASTSSRLLTGNNLQYTQLETTLSKMYNNRASLVFNSGYHANIGILPALTTSKDLILSDKLNHASIIDGMRLADADFKRYNHCDLEHLERLLASNRQKYQNIFIISETVFSMDGDIVDLKKLVEIKEKYEAFLIIDEAHAVGIFGAKGAGLAEELNVIEQVDIIIGTFGKAFGSTGAYAIISEDLRYYLINKMRPLIFTTGLSPLTLSWSNFVLQKVPYMQDERKNLLISAQKLRDIFRAKNLKTNGASQIVPLIIGNEIETLRIAEKFLERNILVFAVRPPTVPVGTSRLRFSLSSNLNPQVIDEIGEVL